MLLSRALPLTWVSFNINRYTTVDKLKLECSQVTSMCVWLDVTLLRTGIPDGGGVRTLTLPVILLVKPSTRESNVIKWKVYKLPGNGWIFDKMTEIDRKEFDWGVVGLALITPTAIVLDELMDCILAGIL